MGLFDAKFCDICGEKISLMGNRKLEDGNMCKNCSAKLSPFLSGRRHTTLDTIKQHLQYREENKQRVAQFNPTMVLGNDTKVYVDQNTGTFAVSSARDWRSTNPDIIDISQVSSVFTEAEEHKKEIFRKDSEGKNVSYNPRRYEYSYEFNTTINVNSPYFDEIKFELTSMSSRPKQRGDMQYNNFEQQGMQIQQALCGGRMGMGMGMNQMGMQGGMGQMGMNQMGMQGGMGQMGGMNQMGGMQGGMGQMGGMNQMGGMQGGMGQMGGMNQMGGMQGGMGQMANAMSGGLGGLAGQAIGAVAGAAMDGLAGNDMQSQMMQQQRQQQMQGMQGQMGMNQMGGMQGGMGQMGGMPGQMGMQGGMNPMGGMPGQMGGGTWVCDCCGTTNTGDVCTACANPKPM